MTPGWTDMKCAVCGCDLTDLDPAYHYWNTHSVMPKPDPPRQEGNWGRPK